MLNFQANVKNTVNIKKIQDFVRKSAVQILVGFPSNLQHVGDEGKAVPTSEIAKAMTYGTDKIPARPFLQEGIDSKKKEIFDELKRQTENAKKGHGNFDKLGTMCVGAIQEFVRGDFYKNSEPNAQSTIDKKGSDRPLIDTGELVNSVTYLIKVKK